MTNSHKLIWAFFLFMALFLTSQVTAQSGFPKRIKLPKELREVSGACKADSVSLWLQNDSQNKSCLYKYNWKQQEITETICLDVPNRDWEDLANTPDGRILIGDFGNNTNQRKDLHIYILDPQTKQVEQIQFSYPDQDQFPPRSVNYWNYDCEAFVVARDSIHLFSKNRFSGNGYTKHYRLPLRAGTYKAQLIDSMYLENIAVSAADFNPETGALAVCGYHSQPRRYFLPKTTGRIIVFEDFGKNGVISKNQHAYPLHKLGFIRQYEALNWLNNHTLIVGNEQKKWQHHALYKVDLTQQD
ncbi:MAG: hypothetical protein R2792_15950 [Saprospiraceae bacterium]